LFGGKWHGVVWPVRDCLPRAHPRPPRQGPRQSTPAGRTSSAHPGAPGSCALQPALLGGCFDSLAVWEQGPPWLSAMLRAMSARVTLSRYWLMTSSSPAQNGRVAHWPDNGHSLISLARQGMGATLPSIAAMISPAVVWAGSFTRR